MANLKWSHTNIYIFTTIKCVNQVTHKEAGDSLTCSAPLLHKKYYSSDVIDASCHEYGVVVKDAWGDVITNYKLMLLHKRP